VGKLEEYIGVKFKSKLKKKNVQRTVSRDIVSAGRRLGAASMVFGNSGNISARVKNGFVITTAGSELDSLGRDDFAVVTGCDLKRRVVMAEGKESPSSESILHHLIYQTKPSVKAIVHTNAGAFLNEAKVSKSGFLSTEVFLEYGTLELAYHVVKTMRKDSFIVIKEHGALAIGADVKSATDLLIARYNELKGIPARLTAPKPEKKTEVEEPEEKVKEPFAEDIPKWAKTVQNERNLDYEADALLEQSAPMNEIQVEGLVQEAEIVQDEFPADEPIPLDQVDGAVLDIEPEPQVVELETPRKSINMPSIMSKICPQCGTKKRFFSRSCANCGFFFNFDNVSQTTNLIKMGRKKGQGE